MDDDVRVYAYCRASTLKQAESPQTQKELCRAYARNNGLGDIHAYFVDASTSGRTPLAERNAGNNMNLRLKRGDHLIVARLDRAFRSFADFASTLDDWDKRGINVHLCDMKVDLSTPIGKAVIRILGAFGEFEREMISVRTKEGLAARKSNGTRHTNHAGYGWRWSQRTVTKDGRKKIVSERERDDKEREAMRQILLWRMERPPWSWAQIVDKLEEMGARTSRGKLWSPARVRRAFTAELKLRIQERG